MKQLIDINKIQLWEQNPRDISDSDFEKLKNKIKRWDLWKPFLVWESKKRILGGNQRYKACKELGYKEVWVEYREPKDEAEALEMAIADNESSGEWIKPMLVEQIKLHEEKIDLEDYKISIKDSSLKDIMPIDIEEDNPLDESEINTVSMLDDLYELNNHRVLCGDSTMIDNVDRLMNGKKADMLFTDPPYGINIVKNDGNVGGNRKDRMGFAGKTKVNVYKPILNDEKEFNPTFLLDKANHLIIWGANNFASLLPNYSHWLVWDKKDNIQLNNDFSDCELAWTNFPKKTVKKYPFLWAGMTRKGERSAELINRIHPTQKPVGLFNNILNDYSNKNWLIMDLFLGSGSTLIACEKSERICYGMELDPHYIDVIVARYIKFMQDQQKPFSVKRNGEVIDPNIFLKS